MNDILVKNLLSNAKKPLFTLEFFPPKNHIGFGMLGSSIERMRGMEPDFISVTYGAGGSTRARTLDVCDLLHKMKLGPVVVHLTCVGASRSQLEETIHEFYGHGFRNIMCLRGDPPQGDTTFVPAADGLAHASDLVALVKSIYPDICCGVAGYPEKHPEATSLDNDIEHLKEKVDQGADFVTTQIFYNNDYYFSYVEKCRAAGITCPVLPGLMPIVSKQQIDRIISLSNAQLPDELQNMIDQAPDDNDTVEKIGMEWTIRQIDELLGKGAPGIHLYVLNRARTATSPMLIDRITRWRQTT